jgi:hypothetical protein
MGVFLVGHELGVSGELEWQCHEPANATSLASEVAGQDDRFPPFSFFELGSVWAVCLLVPLLSHRQSKEFAVRSRQVRNTFFKNSLDCSFR